MNLKEFFKENNKTALAFSGGADSAYLLYAAKKYAKCVKAYYFNSPFQPEFEMKDALRLANELDVEIEIINADLSGKTDILENSALRCYYCKQNMLETLINAAKKDGYSVIIDGTNASDKESDRPGMKALYEKNVISPLKLCGITKEEVYSLSKQAGIFTCNKPSYSCLATRIPTGMSITDALLKKVEGAENCLFSLGFSDFRVRVTDESSAKIQFRKEQLEKAINLSNTVKEQLSDYFKTVTIDTEVFR